MIYQKRTPKFVRNVAQDEAWPLLAHRYSRYIGDFAGDQSQAMPTRTLGAEIYALTGTNFRFTLPMACIRRKFSVTIYKPQGYGLTYNIQNGESSSSNHP
ncbi:uncharacterized protein YALI1_E34100g [Yarrowia lipolytica]|uniref:Uncharacterized protein n=1 Tax=Yarrowia lipolytica TaxID=4952 RepID=A0A1D8NKE6_YARLL|nr:hypothetical protein YALI1_E34100g [Yarrowia lipolytica]